MGGTAGFLRTSLVVVTFLGKSSPSLLRPGGFRGRAARGCRRCQAGRCPGHAMYVLALLARVAPLRALHRAFMAAAMLKSDSPGFMQPGNASVLCPTSLVPLKRTGTVDTHISPVLNSNVGETREMQNLR